MSAPHWIVAVVAAQRLAELVYGQANAARLLEAGGHEVGRGHYPLLVLAHAGWLAALWFLVPAEAAVNWWLIGFYGLLQGLRVWIIASLGRYWTTRIVTLPGAALVRGGPYRYLRHPNYLVVTIEIALLPLAFGAWEIAAWFSALNAMLLAWRLRIENAALAERRGIESP